MCCTLVTAVWSPTLKSSWTAFSHTLLLGAAVHLAADGHVGVSMQVLYIHEKSTYITQYNRHNCMAITKQLRDLASLKVTQMQSTKCCHSATKYAQLLTEGSDLGPHELLWQMPT